MYCKHCGKEITNPKAVICVDCGTKVGEGNKYCGECGTEVTGENQEVCLKCGCSLKQTIQQTIRNAVDNATGKDKSKVAAALLALFLGGLGIHRYYLGYTTSAIVMTVLWVLGFFTLGITFIIVGIWAIVDVILILCNKLEPVNGQYK